ncbi:DUF6912 family protein [uncultured Friedmanniella sp.]|uniref:DUF6912 family protein n=1 Tax=uncultured Friedmanniella sp. TaxID=335381 RepID=UPI0035CA63F7
MVFVPLPLSQAVALRAAPRPGPHDGFAATPELRAALGPDPHEEETDYAALSAAGVAALDGLVGSRRLVVAVEVPTGGVTDRGSGLGEVELGGLRWDQVQALFADEESAAEMVCAAAAAAVGVPVADVLGLPAVVALTDSFDLLWFAPEELDALV